MRQPGLQTAGFVHGTSLWFSYMAALVHTQLVCLLPLGVILNLLGSFEWFVSL